MGSFGISDESGAEQLSGASRKQARLFESDAAPGAFLDSFDGAIGLGGDRAGSGRGGSEALEVLDLRGGDFADS